MVVYSCLGTKQPYLRLLWALCLIWAHNTCGYQPARQKGTLWGNGRILHDTELRSIYSFVIALNYLFNCNIQSKILHMVTIFRL